MLDLDRIRNDPGELRQMLTSRFMSPDDADSLLKQDELRRELATAAQAKKTHRNQLSQKIGALKQNGIYGEEITVIMNEMRTLGSEIAVTDVDIAELSDKIDAFLLSAPNYPHASVPIGKGVTNNAEVYRSGGRRAFAFEAKPYWNIGSELKIFDFDGTAKLDGRQFTVYRGLGARLKRAVTDFLLDAHIRSGYRELMIPYLVMSDEKTGGAPKPILDEACARQGAYPLSETNISIVQLYRERLFEIGELPVRHCAFSASLRSDVSKRGRDSGGLSQRLADAVELMTICKPENSYDELSAMTEQARNVLELLGLPCRVILQCTGEMPYCAAKTYSLEVWMPGSGRYVNVSACSNCEAYLARRLDIRFRETETDESKFCHTLSGSGTSVSRTVAAILETHQNGDGSVTVPDVLRPYMQTDIIR